MSGAVRFRDAHPGDVDAVARAVRGIAEAEGLAHKVTATTDDFRRLLFAEPAMLRCVVAERDGGVVGLALWHPIVTTYGGRLGMYIEDVFVEPACRGQGIGRAVFAEMARRCVAGGYDRLQWSVKNDNLSAVAFYRRLGSETVEGFTTHRVTGGPLAALAGTGSGGPHGGP